MNNGLLCNISNIVLIIAIVVIALEFLCTKLRDSNFGKVLLEISGGLLKLIALPIFLKIIMTKNMDCFTLILICALVGDMGVITIRELRKD